MITFNYSSTTYQLLNIVSGGEVWAVGDDGAKYIKFTFTGINSTNVFNFECRVAIERPDGSKSNDLYMEPNLAGYYTLTITDWVTQQEGNIKFTAKLLVGETTTVFGLATFPVGAGVSPGSDTISQAQYEAIQDSLDTHAEHIGEVEAYLDEVFGYEADQTSAKYLKMDTAVDPDAAQSVGQTRWNSTFKTLETALASGVVLLHGQKLVMYAKNAEEDSLQKGTVVYVMEEVVDGATHLSVKRASTSNDTAYKNLCVTAHLIASGQYGFFVLAGETTLESGHGFAVGSKLYLSTVGTVSTTAPTPPTPTVEIGVVAPGNHMLVNPKLHSKLGSLSDVLITTPGENDLLSWNDVQKRWENVPRSTVQLHIVVSETQPEDQGVGDFWYHLAS